MDRDEFKVQQNHVKFEAPNNACYEFYISPLLLALVNDGSGLCFINNNLIIDEY